PAMSTAHSRRCTRVPRAASLIRRCCKPIPISSVCVPMRVLPRSCVSHNRTLKEFARLRSRIPAMRSSMIRWDARFALALALASVPALALALANVQPSVPAQTSPQTSKPDNETWLTDAEGRQYRLEPIPKAQAVKVDDTHVRTIFGVPAELAREDD